MVLTKLLDFIKQLSDRKWTGQLRLNFHEGNLSEKIEKKESEKLIIADGTQGMRRGE